MRARLEWRNVLPRGSCIDNCLWFWSGGEKQTGGWRNHDQNEQNEPIRRPLNVHNEFHLRHALYINITVASTPCMSIRSTEREERERQKD